MAVTPKSRRDRKAEDPLSHSNGPWSQSKGQIPNWIDYLQEWVDYIPLFRVWNVGELWQEGDGGQITLVFGETLESRFFLLLTEGARVLWILPTQVGKSAKLQERGLFCVLNRTESLQ